MFKHRSAPLRNDENFWVSKDGLDVGLYKEADRKGMSFSMLLEAIKSEKQQQASPYLGMTKSEVIEQKQAMRRAGQIAPLTAFEECLAKAGIQVAGKYTDPVSKFFEYSDTDVLFPEFIADKVYTGMLSASLVPEFVSMETVVSSKTFQKLYLDDSEVERELREVGDLEDLPETKISVGDKSVHLGMYGRYIKTSKLDLNQMRANVVGNFMDKIGLQIGIDQTDLLIYRLINGDGNANTTPGTTKTASASGAGAIDFEDTITWATALPTPYKMDKFVGRKANLVKWYNRLYDGTTTSVGNDFMGIFPKPFEWDRSVVTSNYFWGVDSRYAAEFITIGGVQVNAEDIVRQLAKGIAVYTLYEFAIADKNAVAKFDMSS